MRRLPVLISLILTCSVVLALFGPALPAYAEGLQPGKPKTGRMIVYFKTGTSGFEIRQAAARAGTTVESVIPRIGAHVVRVSPEKTLAAEMIYRSFPSVTRVEADYSVKVDMVPSDASFSQQWGLSKVQAQQAWDITQGIPSVRIAILDTGIDLNHVDLSGKIAVSRNMSQSDTDLDRYGHGTHVAGIAAAATDNAIGVAGLGFRTRLMNVKVLGDNGSGYYSNIAQGVIWAADNGANVINLSLGGGVDSATLRDAIDYAWNRGVVVLAAAGNNGSTAPSYPAYYSNAIAVAATDQYDRRYSFSNYGAWVDIAAPGSALSTVPGDKYRTMSGTSMATPFVSGLAGLAFALASDRNGNGRVNDEVREMIMSGADNIGVSGIGAGRINAYRTVSGAAPAGGRIAGAVIDSSTGKPIAGASVTDGTRTATTGSNGAYAIESLSAGTYNVTAAAGGYQLASQTVSVSTGQTTTASFALIPSTGRISGNVASAGTGLGIAGATVSTGTRWAATGSDGTYVLSNLSPGNHTLTASAAGYQSSSMTANVTAGQTTAANLALALSPTAGRIAGKVSNAVTGAAIAGATVSAAGKSANTGSDGLYAIENIASGTYTATSSAAGYSYVSQTISVTAGQTSTANFALSPVPTTGNIAGKLTSAGTGQAIAGAVVTSGTSSVTTGADGLYRFDNLIPGSYKITASMKGYQKSSTTVYISAGQSVTVDFALAARVNSSPRLAYIGPRTVTEGSSLQFTVSGSDPDEEDTLVFSAGHLPAGAKFDAAMRMFSWTPAPGQAGTYSIRFDVSDCTAMASETITVIVSKPVTTGRIQGRVTDSMTRVPISGANVYDSSRYVKTDFNGLYVIENVPAGTYTLTVRTEGHYPSSRTITVAAGQTTETNFSYQNSY